MSDIVFRKGQVGAQLKVTVEEAGVAVDLSTATVKSYKIRKPDGVLLDKSASFQTNGIDGKLVYATIANDLDKVGRYVGEAYIELQGMTLPSTSFAFLVEDRV